MPTKRKKKKSPLKTKPLRQAGESLAEELDDVIGTKIMPWMSLILTFTVLAGFEWLRWWRKMPPQPVLFSILALVAIVVSIWRIWKSLKYGANLYLGRQGEIVVSQCLDSLKSDGYRVFDDIIGDGFNVDHVLVGPGGVFAIETKTHSKPGGDVHVVYDGKTLTVAGHTPDRNPIEQVINASRHIRDILKTEVPDIKVKSVLIYPGWYTEQPRNPEVWVLNETVLPKWIRKELRSLTDEKAARISGILATHVRGKAY